MAQDLDTALGNLRIDKSRKRPPNRRWFRMLLYPAAVVLVIAALGAYQKNYAAVAVKVAKPVKQAPSTEGEEMLVTSGYVAPRTKIEISSKIVGWLKEIYVDQGDVVKKGDLLIRLDDAEYQAQVRQAEAAEANAAARLAELRAGSRPQEIKAARANIESARATLKRTEFDVQRLERLRKEDVVSDQELDTGRAAYRVAQANLEAAKENADLVFKGPRKEQIAAAEALLRQAQANHAFAQTQLAYTEIRAPISGTILEKLAEKGELVTNVNFGGTRGAKSSVVSMADLGDLQVELDVNESDLPKVRLGQATRIRLDSSPDVVFTGKVDEIAPEADRQKGTVQVKTAIDNPRGLIRPEVTAQVSFLAPPQPKSAGPARTKVFIPPAAVVKGHSASVVYVAVKGKAEKRLVTVGEEGAKGVEILSGLDGAELVIVSPLDKLRDGRRIRIAV